ncbi:MAG: cysteine--tRNA ligase [Bacteroidota bacterium]
MPTLRLTNTLTRETEEVTPAQADADGTPLLRVYGCGPTVYSYAHIGNFRSFLTTDLLLRTARALGWKTRYVSNVTDVGHLTGDDLADADGTDKMAKALEREGARFANIFDLARHYTDALLDDWRALNLLEPDVRPRATEHVTEQIEAVEQLVAAGHAYETDDGVYFHVPSFPDYGKLSGNRDAESLATGAAAESREVVTDDAKRDPRDFALWKKDPGHLMQWYSPFAEGAAGGRGFPGWHIECSVMARHYLGDAIDVHTGGEDLIFPHHECEIAQAESLSGEPFARVWLHTRFLQVEGERMSKSSGNFFTVRDLVGERGLDPLAVRYALISGHYRKPFNFTEKNLQDAQKNRARYVEAAEIVQKALDAEAENPTEPPPSGTLPLKLELDVAYNDALGAMADNLNTPRALAAGLTGVSRILAFARGYKHFGSQVQHAKSFLDDINALLGIVYPEDPTDDFADEDPLAAQVEALLAERAEVRAAKDWPRADAIRDELDALGVEVMDSAQGTTWRKKAGA